MRQGRKLRRTLYLETGGGPERDLCMGIVDTELIAHQICLLWNADAVQTRSDRVHRIMVAANEMARLARMPDGRTWLQEREPLLYDEVEEDEWLRGLEEPS
jgi:hypothetical protein